MITKDPNPTIDLTCIFCGGDEGAANQPDNRPGPAHNLCIIRWNHGAPTPCLGMKWRPGEPAADGSMEFWNSYQQKVMTWNPETQGTWFGVAEGMSGFDGQSTMMKALASMALLQARFPDRAFILVHAPCFFSRRESWIFYDDKPGYEVFRDAEATALRLKTCGDSFLTRDAYKRRHGLSTSFM